MSKRVHELAKEWAVNPKDLLAAAERINIRSKRSQSSLTDEEAERIKEAMGLVPKPVVTLGAERIVAERMVTDREVGTQLVTAREQTTETRLRANVIRRRTAREVVKREDLPAAVPGDMEGLPPSLGQVTPIDPGGDFPANNKKQIDGYVAEIMKGLSAPPGRENVRTKIEYGGPSAQKLAVF